MINKINFHFKNKKDYLIFFFYKNGKILNKPVKDGMSYQILMINLKKKKFKKKIKKNNLKKNLKKKII